MRKLTNLRRLLVYKMTRNFSLRSLNQRYVRDNRLIKYRSSYVVFCLAPRCRLFTACCRTVHQEFDCSSIKVERELGLKRREIVWFLSTAK